MPGGQVEVLDALVKTSDVYRKRYGYKKDLFGLSAEGSLVVSQSTSQSVSQRLSGSV